MAKITKDTLIMDCLKINPNSAEILQSVGMHCLGCAMAHGETIEEAVFVHGKDNNRFESGGEDFEPVASAGGAINTCQRQRVGARSLHFRQRLSVRCLGIFAVRRRNDENFKIITPENYAVCYVDARFRRMWNI